jgi:hypothetical protein
MKILTKDELEAIKAESSTSERGGSFKDAKTKLVAMIEANRGKTIQVTPEDVAPYHPEGITPWLINGALKEGLKVKAVYFPKATKIKTVRKGQEISVDRFESVTIEC